MQKGSKTVLQAISIVRWIPGDGAHIGDAERGPGLVRPRPLAKRQLCARAYSPSDFFEKSATKRSTTLWSCSEGVSSLACWVVSSVAESSVVTPSTT